ncbi:MAG TPA: hypothetical protein VGM88_08010 [Kofleriaceae bacterium]|jgi:DNA-binding beta-propeller fold protein YncE
MSPGARLAAISLIAAGCTASAQDVQPHPDQITYPTGLAVSPDDKVLFVAEANSDLEYDSGQIGIVDLDLADSIISGWVSSAKTVPDGCSQDTDHLETLICDETPFLHQTAGVRVGNFTTTIAIEHQDDKTRLIIPTRGDPSITWVDWDGTNLNCNTSGLQFDICDDAHRLSFLYGDADQTPLPAEPYDAFADAVNGFAVVTHQSTGSVTLVDSPLDSQDVQITDIILDEFAPDALTGLPGATGVAGRTPSVADGDMVYVGSRSEDRVQTYSVERPGNASPPFLSRDNFFFLDSVGSYAGSSTDTRGMTFSSDGSRLYLVNRNPPSLQIYDTSASDTGFPKNTLVGATDLCRQGSTVDVLDTGDGDRAYIVCFGDGEVYVVDPRGTSQVSDIITVGRGPYAATASVGRKRLYVSNFLEDTIAVIDIDPLSATRDRVVLRIGVPKPPDKVNTSTTGTYLPGGFF